MDIYSISPETWLIIAGVVVLGIMLMFMINKSRKGKIKTDDAKGGDK